ncbi:thioesterase family protein [Phenylobacterium sp.]|uniref:acyl-CoA thioesterase n=1 Tax=Phenylobacterium sp. TaxID=1871053 RepID=UPI00286BB353|nr:thioesterase family protein [Phenylobacterium sp.]
MTPTTIAEHPLDKAVRLEPRGVGLYRGATTPDYWNMAGPFGGTTAAILLKAVLDHPERRGRPVALTVNFCAAVAEGEFEVSVRLVRDGRSTQHWNVEMTQGETVASTASAVTGAERDTWSHALAAPPVLPPPHAVATMPTDGRNAWLKRYEFRYVLGEPTRGLASAEAPGSAATQAWVRDEPARPLDYLALTALSDTFVVKILNVRGDVPPVATVSLSTYFMADEAALARQGARPLAAVSDARVFRHGFNDQSAELWSDDGQLLAVSHQVVWFKG